jgi:hypothetical protein
MPLAWVAGGWGSVMRRAKAAEGEAKSWCAVASLCPEQRVAQALALAPPRERSRPNGEGERGGMLRLSQRVPVGRPIRQRQLAILAQVAPISDRTTPSNRRTASSVRIRSAVAPVLASLSATVSCLFVIRSSSISRQRAMSLVCFERSSSMRATRSSSVPPRFTWRVAATSLVPTTSDSFNSTAWGWKRDGNNRRSRRFIMLRSRSNAPLPSQCSAAPRASRRSVGGHTSRLLRRPPGRSCRFGRHRRSGVQ